MTTRPISAGQMKRLQTLYGQLCAHEAGRGADRDSRLIWAAGLLERPVASFRDLTQEDARHLIDTLQGQFGIPSQTRAQRPRPRRRRLGAEDARRAGTEGRRGRESNSSTMASGADLARIRYALDELGWSQDQFEGWLRSSRSPLGPRSNPQIRTLGDANRAWWALKRMIDARKRRC